MIALKVSAKVVNPPYRIKALLGCFQLREYNRRYCYLLLTGQRNFCMALHIQGATNADVTGSAKMMASDRADREGLPFPHQPPVE